jgi:hypothetical protein
LRVDGHVAEEFLKNCFCHFLLRFLPCCVVFGCKPPALQAGCGFLRLPFACLSPAFSGRSGGAGVTEDSDCRYCFYKSMKISVFVHELHELHEFSVFSVFFYSSFQHFLII